MEVASHNATQHATPQGKPAQRIGDSPPPRQRGSAHELLRTLARKIYKPRERITVSTWADRYRELPAEGAAEPGRWQTARTPYLREIMDAYMDTAVTQISLMFGAQLGKTEAIMNMIFYTMDVLGQSCMFMWPTENDVKEFNEKRLRPSVDACRKIKEILVKTDPITMSGVKFKGGYVDYAMAKTARTQKGKPRGKIFADEIDEYEDPGALGRVRNRSKTFSGRKLVCSSTPTDEQVGIHAEYLAGDQRKYFVPCPHCEHMQVLQFSRLKWEGGAHANEDAVRFNTWYECEECLERISEFEKAGMIAQGQWRATREDLVESGAKGKAGGKTSSHRSYQLSELYSPFPESTWGDIAAEFVKHKGLPPPEFYTERLGEPYTAKGKRIEAHALRLLCTAKAEGGYLMREIPPEVRVLIAAADVQHNRFYYVCEGFGDKGEQSWLIDAREILCKQSTPIAELEAFIRSVKYEQKRIGPNGLTMSIPWRPVLWGVDTGDQTRDLYNMVSRFRPSNPAAALMPKVLAIKGSGERMGVPYDEKIHNKMRDGTKLAYGVHLLLVNASHYNEAIYSGYRADPRLGLLKSDDGEIMGQKRFFMPGDTPDDFLHHMTSEEYRKVSDKKNRGFGSWAWMRRPGASTRTDFLDCKRYLLALADRTHLNLLGKTLTGFNVLNSPTPTTPTTPTNGPANAPTNAPAGTPIGTPGGAKVQISQNNFGGKTMPKISIKH